MSYGHNANPDDGFHRTALVPPIQKEPTLYHQDVPAKQPSLKDDMSIKSITTDSVPNKEADFNRQLDKLQSNINNPK